MSALIRVTLSISSAQLRPGERTEITVTVRNYAEIVDRYSIVVLGVPPEWVSLSRPEVALFPKDEDQVVATILPPAGAGTRGGHYDVRIQAISREMAGEQSAADFSLDVASVLQLEAALRPQRGSGIGDGTFRLQLVNGGNTDLALQLTATDPEEGLLFAFEPARLVVPAGQECAVVLRAHPKTPLAGSESHTYPFTITVQPADAPEKARQVQGEWIQVAPAYELALRPAYATGTVEGSFTVVVNNRGTDDLTLSFEAADPAQACTYTFTPPEAIVPAGQERSLALQVRPRGLLAGRAPQVYRFTVTARPAEAAQSTRQAHGEWEQAPPAFGVALQPVQPTGVEEGRFSLQVTNPSSTDLTVQLEAADPARACTYTWNPAVVFVPAGQERQAQLRVRANARLRGAVPLMHAFTVTARPAEAPGLVRELQGQWVQSTPPPPAGHFWGPLLLLTLGWGAAYGLAVALRLFLQPLWASFIFDWTMQATGIPDLAEFLVGILVPGALTGLILGAGGGLATGLAARWAEPAARTRQVLGVVFGWLLVFLAQRLILGGLRAYPSDDFYTPLFQAIAGAAVGLAGGAVTARALRRVRPRLSSFWLAAAWGVAWGVGEGVVTWLWYDFPDLFYPVAHQLAFLTFGDPDLARWLAAATIVGLFAGLVGGLLTLWGMFAARRKETG